MSYPDPFKSAVVKAEQLLSIYSRAQIELDAIWPAYKAWAEKEDARELAEEATKYQDELAEFIREREENAKQYRKAKDLYLKALDAWTGTFWLFRGPKPVEPSSWPLLRASAPFPSYLYRSTGHRVEYAMFVRDEVDSVVRLAQSGPDNFSFTKPQLQRMLLWVDGKVIERMKEVLAEGSEA